MKDREPAEIRSGYMVVYADAGPGGYCGQSMSTRCPHTYVAIYDSYDDFCDSIRAGIKELGRSGKCGRTDRHDIDGNRMRFFDHRRRQPDPAVAELVAVCRDLAAAKSQQDVWDIQPRAIAVLAKFPEGETNG